MLPEPLDADSVGTPTAKHTPEVGQNEAGEAETTGETDCDGDAASQLKALRKYS